MKCKEEFGIKSQLVCNSDLLNEDLKAPLNSLSGDFCLVEIQQICLRDIPYV